MSEPIRLWDKDGVLWVTYSPSAARLAVEAGTHTYTQPAQSIYESPMYGAGKTRPATEIIAAFKAIIADDTTWSTDAVSPLTPDDTQEVAAVKPPAVYSPSRAHADAKAEILLQQSTELLDAREQWLKSDILLQKPTPDDTQEVATVKPPKRRREKGDGGVL
jgi:hypothetical protein